MQSSNNSSRGYPYQSTQQSSSTSPPAGYVDPNAQATGYSTNPQSSSYGHAQAGGYQGNPQSTNPQYMHQQYAQGGQPAAGAPLGSGVPPQYQGYPHLDRGGPVVPSQLHAQGTSSPHSYTYPPAQPHGTQYAHYPNASPSGGTLTASPPPAPSSPSSSSTMHSCSLCGATFTRSHDRKRHYESQHTTIEHVCQYCRKSYARSDSLKRHHDKPCDKMPQPAPKK